MLATPREGVGRLIVTYHSRYSKENFLTARSGVLAQSGNYMSEIGEFSPLFNPGQLRFL